MAYIVQVAVQLLLFVGLAYALDLILGTTGILNICHAAFFGIGAYTAALLSHAHPYPLLMEVAVACGVAALLAVIVSLPSMRLNDDFFVLASFAFQVILSQMLVNWNSVTNGPLGISDIPAPVLWRNRVLHGNEVVFCALAVAGVIFLCVRRLQKSPYGRVLRAIRSDEIFAQALGKATVKGKVTAFVMSGVCASIVGVLYAHYMTFIDPGSFDANASITFITLVILGGAGSKWGPAVGSLLVILLPEGLRFISIPSAVGPAVKQVVFSISVLLVLIFRSRGLAGHHDFGRVGKR